MKEYGVILILVLLSASNINNVKGACTYPAPFSSPTVWRDTSKGDITFTSTTKFSGWTVNILNTNSTTINTTITGWNCHWAANYTSNGYLVAVSDKTFPEGNKSYYAFICMKITPIIPNVSYRYYLHNPITAIADYERITADTNSTSTDWNKICLFNSSYASLRPAKSEYRVLIKTSSLTTAKVNCPYTFLGKYEYNHTDSYGNVTCTNSSDTWDMCTTAKEMSFNYTSCATKVAYSVATKVWCVDTVTSEGNEYVTVLNGNDASTSINNINVFLSACFAISSDGTMASVAPRQCRKDQMPGVMPLKGSTRIGATLRMTAKSLCPSCTNLTKPISGTLTYITDGATSTASYVCDTNHNLTGSASRTCQANTTWTGTTPLCTCVNPTAPVNGSMDAPANNTYVTYYCNLGFSMSGNQIQKCNGTTNTWIGTAPTCKKCGSLSNVTDGGYNISTNGTNTLAKQKCSKGYYVYGATVLTCSNGTWETNLSVCVPTPVVSAPISTSSAGLRAGVIVLGVSTGVLAVALGVTIAYIKKAKLNSTGTEKSSVHTMNGSASVNNTSKQIPPVETPQSTRQSTALSDGNIQVNLVRDNTSVAFTPQEPAPWNKTSGNKDVPKPGNSKDITKPGTSKSSIPKLPELK